MPQYALRTVRFPVNNPCHNFPLRTPPRLVASLRGLKFPYRQRYRIIKGPFPAKLSHWRASLAAISSPPIKAPILFVAATACGEAGFCHEDLFMSDSAMPMGCAGGLAGAHANGRSGNSPCVGPPRRAWKC